MFLTGGKVIVVVCACYRMSNLVATISFRQQLLSGVQSSSNNCPKWPHIVADNKPAGYIAAHRFYEILEEKLRLRNNVGHSPEVGDTRTIFNWETCFILNEWMNKWSKILWSQKTWEQKRIQNLPTGRLRCTCLFATSSTELFVFVFVLAFVFVVYLHLLMYLYLQVGVWGRGGQLHWLNCDQPHWTFLSNNGFLCFHSASP